VTRLDRVAGRDRHQGRDAVDAPIGRGLTTPFLIVGQARTGSNLLQFELNRRWREIRCQGECYRSDERPPGGTADAVSAAVFTPQGDETIHGCRVFYHHLEPSEWDQVLRTEGLRVVHLRRRNLLRRFVSLRIAATNQMWMQYAGDPQPDVRERAVTVDLDRFVRDYESSLAAYASMEAMLAAHDVPVLDVWYEDLVADLNGECQRVASFLGAGPPWFRGRPELRRQNPETLSRLVTNYGEVRRVLAKSRLHSFLEEDDPVHRTGWRARGGPRSCWPTPEQELLLATALAAPDDVASRLAAWERAVDPAEVDSGSRRLYPLLYRTLRRADIDSALLPELKRSYVDASVRNQRLLRTLEEVLARLDAAAVPTLVLKGAALIVAYYRDRGARPMADLDVMVPRDRVEAALAALRADGWELVARRPDRPIAELQRVRHSVLLQRDADQLDLHWDAFAESLGTDLADRLWGAADELTIGARRTQTLAAADHLLHAFVHGLRYNPVPPLRWVADAHVTIGVAGDAVDWDRLSTLAEAYRLVAPVAAALGYLDERFPGLVPREVLHHVRGLRVTREEQRAFELVTREHWFLGSGGVLWRAHRRRDPDAGIVRSVVGFLDDLRILYDLDHVGELPGRVLDGVFRRRRHDRQAA
jgi:hypothetical protein